MRPTPYTSCIRSCCGGAVAAGVALTRVSPWLYIGLCLVLICIVSVAAWRWFERPVTKALQGSRKS